MLTPEDKSGRQLRSVCIHEISHAFAAMQRCAKIGFALERTAQGKWTGQTIGEIADNDKNLDSVYGWAGVVGEAIEANREHAVLLALHRYRNQRSSISDTDLDSIECVTPDCRTKTAEMAFQALVGSWNEIKALQNKVLTLIETEKQPGVMFVWTKKDGWKQH